MPRVLLSIDVPRQDFELAQRAKDARGKEGWTSVRVDKATHARLGSLARKLDPIGKRNWQAVTLAELLDILSRGEITTHAPDDR